MAKKDEIKEVKVTKTLEEWRAEKMPVVYFKKPASKISVMAGIGHVGYESGLEIDFYNDKSWLFNSAKVLNKWALGEVLTEEEFDAGIKRAAEHFPAQRRV